MSLPIPADRYIPAIYPRDALLTALADKMDEHIEGWRDDVIQLEWLHQPERCPSALLGELGYWLAAGLDSNDTDRQKREKIAAAVQGHKRRGSWADDAKPKVDAVAGGDAVLFPGTRTGLWVATGDGALELIDKWSSVGGDGVDTTLGLAPLGNGDEAEEAGVVYIDVDNATLTAAQQAEIIEELQDIVPAYFIVVIGYVSAGAFIEYDRTP